MVLKKMLCLLVILSSTSLYAEECMVYTVPHTYKDLVATVEKVVNEPRTKPFRVPNLPVIIEGKDISIQVYIKPSQRYYRAKITLDKPIGKLTRFNKTIEIWGQSDKYVIRSSVDIKWGRDITLPIISKIKEKIIHSAECGILCVEKNKILEYSGKMEKNLEKEISWCIILQDAWILYDDLKRKLNDGLKERH